MIKDAKEVEGAKRKEKEKEQQDKFGWGGLDKKNMSGPGLPATKETPAATKASGAAMDVDGLKASATVKTTTTNITFSKGGPPKFNKATKSALNQQEFPELGEAAGPKKNESANTSKKD